MDLNLRMFETVNLFTTTNFTAAWHACYRSEIEPCYLDISSTVNWGASPGSFRG